MPRSGDYRQVLGGRRLFVDSAQMKHEGVYVCVVRNAAGESKLTYNVYVQCTCIH